MPEALGLSQKLRVTNEITQQCSLNKYNEEVRLNSLVLLKGMFCLQHRPVCNLTLQLQGFSNFQKARDLGLCH